MTNYQDQPCAAVPWKSYRYPNRYGEWIMIGASDDAGALREAQRSTTETVEMAKLQRWGGEIYVAAKS